MKVRIKVGAKRSRSFGVGESGESEGHYFLFVFFKGFSSTVYIFVGKETKESQTRNEEKRSEEWKTNQQPDMG